MPKFYEDITHVPTGTVIFTLSATDEPGDNLRVAAENPQTSENFRIVVLSGAGTNNLTAQLVTNALLDCDPVRSEFKTCLSFIVKPLKTYILSHLFTLLLQ